MWLQSHAHISQALTTMKPISVHFSSVVGHQRGQPQRQPVLQWPLGQAPVSRPCSRSYAAAGADWSLDGAVTGWCCHWMVLSLDGAATGCKSLKEWLRPTTPTRLVCDHVTWPLDCVLPLCKCHSLCRAGSAHVPLIRMMSTVDMNMITTCT